jgi:hypothetical protein
MLAAIGGLGTVVGTDGSLIRGMVGTAEGSEFIAGSSAIMGVCTAVFIAGPGDGSGVCD